MSVLPLILRYLPVWLPALIAGFVGMDLWLARPVETARRGEQVMPFSHAQHGDSLGLNCTYCHTGVLDQGAAGMPTKSTCLDCHRVPVSTSPNLEALDRVLQLVPEKPWIREPRLPTHVRFHHVRHSQAGVSCLECHGSPAEIDAGRLAAVDMQSCITCHRADAARGASTDCSVCHR